MALITKVDFWFAQHQYGWSETYWRYNDPSLAVSLKQAEIMADFRCKLMGGQTRLDVLRVSDMNINFDSLVSDKVYYCGKEFAGGESEREYTALMVRQKAFPGYGRTLYLRGFPKGIIYPAPPGDVDSNAFQVYYDQWFLNNFFQQGSWRIRALSRLATFSKFPATAVVSSGAPNNRFRITIPMTQPLDAARVRLSGFKTTDFLSVNINTEWEVKLKDNFEFEIAQPWLVGYAYTGGGFVRYIQEEYPVIFHQAIMGKRRRKTGDAYGQRKGRLSKSRS